MSNKQPATWRWIVMQLLLWFGSTMQSVEQRWLDQWMQQGILHNSSFWCYQWFLWKHYCQSLRDEAVNSHHYSSGNYFVYVIPQADSVSSCLGDATCCLISFSGSHPYTLDLLTLSDFWRSLIETSSSLVCIYSAVALTCDGYVSGGKGFRFTVCFQWEFR